MKKYYALLLAALLVASALAGCSKGDAATSSSASTSTAQSETASAPATKSEIIGHNNKIDPDTIRLIQSETPPADAKTVVIKTDLGDLKAVLYPSEAPKAVENFLALAKDGFYDGMSIYEVIPDVRFCAGATDAAGSSGKSASGSPFEDEYSLNLWHFNGALAMNNGAAPGQNDSRFYIVQNPKITDETMNAAIDGAFPEKVINQYLKVGGVPNYDFRDTVFGQVTEGLDLLEKIGAVERDAQNRPKTDLKIQSITIS